MRIENKRGILLKKAGIFLFMFIAGLLLVFALKIGYATTLSCEFTSSSSCNSPNVSIIYAQNDSGGYENAHTQNVTNSSFDRYNYALCCSSDQTLGRNCSEATFLKISNATNAHAQAGNFSGASNYSTSMCFSVGLGTMQCTYANDVCASNYTCIASIASSEAGDANITNAHIGTCGHYQQKICCKAGNILPVVTLISPGNGNSTTNRRPTFIWNATDGDGDFLTYQINITSHAYMGAPITSCSDSILVNVSATNYTPTYDLPCLWDNGYVYNWSVRANDEQEYGEWTTKWKLNVTADTTISLLNNTMFFGSIALLSYNDSEDNSPAPFVIQNDGNSFLNISLSGTDLWYGFSNPSKYYKFKIANNTIITPNENGSFNWASSLTSWRNVSTSAVTSIAYLNYSNATDSAEADIYVEVPPAEPPGTKSSTITFMSILGE